MPRNIPRGVLTQEMASRRSASRYFSSRVVGRLETASTSRSLLGRKPPRTADPKRYAPTTTDPSTSLSRARPRSGRLERSMRRLHDHFDALARVQAVADVEVVHEGDLVEPLDVAAAGQYVLEALALSRGQ